MGTNPLQGGTNVNKEKLRYAILKEIYKGNNKLSENDFSITEEQFDEAIRFLHREKYLSGIFYADDRPWLFEGTVYLTEKGEKYLKENKSFSKLYKGLKEVREWLKLLV